MPYYENNYTEATTGVAFRHRKYSFGSVVAASKDAFHNSVVGENGEHLRLGT